MKRFLIMMIFMFTGLNGLYGAQYQKRTQISILPARPIDFGTGTVKSMWATALIDKQIRFRLEPLSEVRTFSKDEIADYIPNISKFDIPINESSYGEAARKLGAQYILNEKHELIKDKTVHFYFELTAQNANQKTLVFEQNFPIEKFSTGIDSCLTGLLNTAGVKYNPETVRFFQIPVLSENIKNNRQLGEIMLRENSSKPSSDELLIKEYESSIIKDPYLLLANYSCGLLCFKAKQYAKSARYIKELLDLTPIHTSLYISLTQSYRLAGQFQDALNSAQLGLKLNFKTTEFLLEKALALEEMGQSGQASVVHSQILSIDKDQPYSLLYLAKQRNDETNYKEAQLYLLHLVKITPSNGKAWFELGRSLYGQKIYDKALLALNNAEKYSPDDPVVQEWLGDLYLRKQDNKSAALHFKKASEAGPEKLDLIVKTAQALQLDLKSNEALALLKKAEPKFTGNPQFNKALGLLEYSMKDFNHAAVNLESYANKAPAADYDVLTALGSIYSQTGNIGKALEMFQRALPLTGDKNKCKISIAEIYIKKNDSNSARNILEEVLSVSQIKGVHGLMGDALLMSGDTKNALTHYEKERELHGVDSLIQEKIALLEFDRELYVPAKTELQKLLSISPNNPIVRYYLAIIFLKDGNLKATEQYLDDAPKFGKGNAKIFFRLGNEFVNKKQFQSAVRAFENCITFDPRNEEALRNLGDANVAAGHDSAGAEAYVALFYLQNSKYSSYLAKAGHIFSDLKLFDKASNACSLFLQKGFSDFSVNVEYAGIVYAKKDYTTVISLLKNINGNYTKDEKIVMMLAESYCRTGQYQPAIPFLNSVLSMNSQNRRAIELSAVAFDKTGNFREAVSMYEKLVSFPPDGNYREYSFHLGELYEKNHMTDKAISRYEHNIKEAPDDLRNHEHLAMIYMSGKKWEQSQRVLEAAVKFPQVAPGLQKMLAQTYSARDNKTDAAAMYSKYLSKVKTDSLAWKELGGIYFAQKKYAEAIDPLSHACQRMDGDFDACWMLGKSLMETGAVSKAVAPLSRAQSLSQNNTGVLELLSNCYRTLKETSSLKSVLEKWASIDPNRYDIRMELGSMYLDEKRIDEAVKMLNEAMRFIPTESKPHLLLAKAYEMTGKDSLRFRQLSDAVHLAPGSWDAQFQMGLYYISKNNKTEARQYLTKSLELNPSNGRAHFEYGCILLDRGENEKAFDEFQTALETEHENPLFLAVGAYSFCTVNKTKSGLDMIKTALKKSPNDPSILYWAGMVYKSADQREQARGTFKYALSLNADYAPCYEALGDMYLEEAKFKPAAENFFKSWEKGGFNESRAFKLGTALSYDYKFAEARDFFETIVQRNPSNSRALYNVISSCCKLGDIKKAKKLIDGFHDKDPEWMHLAQGEIYEADGNLEAAWVSFKVAMKLAPDNPYVHAGFGRLQLKQKQFDSAVVHLSTAAAVDSLNMELLIDQGKAFNGMGDLASAFQYYSEVERRYPEHPEVYSLMADVRSAQKEHLAAVQILEKGIASHPKDYDLFYKLGRELESANQFEPAIQAYQTALKKGKDTPIEAMKHIGNIYYHKMINDKKAKEFYKKYMKAGGKDEEVASIMKKLEGI